MNQDNRNQADYNEVNLMDYVAVIFKKKRLIVAIFLTAVVITGIVSFLMKKVYRIDTAVEIGKLSEEQSIEEPIQLVEEIKNDFYGVKIREALNISEKKYPKMTVENPKDTKLVTIAIESDSTEMAKKILERMNDLILADHQNRIKAKQGLLENDIKTAESKIKLTESDIEKTKSKITPMDNDIKRIENKIIFAENEKRSLEEKVDALQKILPYQQDPGTQFALFDAKEKLANKENEIESLYMSINSFKRDKEDLDVQVNSLKTNIENLNAQINYLKNSLENILPTKIVKSPFISEKQVKPRPVLNMAIAGVLGIFIGLLLAFGKEWWQKNKGKI